MNNGAENIGNYNNGIGNVGEYNNGSYNIGSYNIGCFNKTNYAIGFFNTEPCKEFRIFNKKLPKGFVFDYEGFMKALSGYYGYFKIFGKGMFKPTRCTASMGKQYIIKCACNFK